MRKKRTIGQIISILEKKAVGAGIDSKIFYTWERKYREVIEDYINLKKENARLRKMYTDLSVLHNTLHDAFNSLVEQTERTCEKRGLIENEYLLKSNVEE